MSVEVWKTYPNNDGYEVSSHGRVRVRTKRGRTSMVGRILKPWMHRGYQMVGLYPGPQKLMVHWLVLETFVGPRPDGWCSNHKNGDKSNPRLDNLEWSTYSDNNQHAYDTGLKRKGECHPQAKLSNNDVEEIKNLVLSGVKQYVVGHMFKIDSSYVSRIVSGRFRRAF